MDETMSRCIPVYANKEKPRDTTLTEVRTGSFFGHYFARESSLWQSTELIATNVGPHGVSDSQVRTLQMN